MAKMTASVFSSLVPSSKGTTVSVNAFIFDLVKTWPDMFLGHWEGHYYYGKLLSTLFVEIEEVTSNLGCVGSSFRFKLCLIRLAHRYKSFTTVFRKCVLLPKKMKP